MIEHDEYKYTKSTSHHTNQRTKYVLAQNKYHSNSDSSYRKMTKETNDR